MMELGDSAKAQISELIRSGTTEMIRTETDELRQMVEALTASVRQLTNLQQRPSANPRQNLESTAISGIEQGNPTANETLFGTSFFENVSGNFRTPQKSLINPVDLPKYYGEPEKAAAWLRRYETNCGLKFWSEEELIRGIGRCFEGKASN